jgi:hypothetical protein
MRGRVCVVEEHMGIVRLGPNGEVEIIERGTEEGRERAEAAVRQIARLLGRQMAREEFARQIAAGKSLDGEPSTS